MKLLWKLKAMIYDPTIRRIGPIHSFMRFLVWHLSDFLLTTGSRVTRLEVPRTEVPPYFLFPYVFGMHEREVVAWYRRYLRQDMCVVDIGAYIGYHTVRFARMVGRNGKAIAFEPYGPSFEILKRNVQRARLTNVVLEQRAVSDQNGYVTLHLSSGWAGNSLIRVDEKHFQSCQVESITLDDYFSDNDQSLDLVKIDAEGAEPNILWGMRSLLEKKRVKALILEFYPALLRVNGTHETPTELLNTLMKDFDVYHIGSKGKLRRIESYEVEDFVISVRKWTNLCAIIK